MTVEEKIWHNVFDDAKGYCQYCGDDLLISRAAYRSAQVDHVLARAKGGDHKIENLRLACSGCNSSMSRYNHLTTFDDRKKHIANGLEIHETNYRDKFSKLREPVTKG